MNDRELMAHLNLLAKHIASQQREINRLKNRRATPWIDFVLINDFVAAGDPYFTPQYRLVGDDFDIRGVPVGGSLGTVFAYVPETTFWPKKVKRLHMAGGNDGTQHATVDYGPDGSVTLVYIF